MGGDLRGEAGVQDETRVTVCGEAFPREREVLNSVDKLLFRTSGPRTPGKPKGTKLSTVWPNPKRASSPTLIANASNGGSVCRISAKSD
jgi:hypothetical protein